EIATADHFNRLFEISVEQPLDHNNPNGSTFTQKVYLGHVDFDTSLAFETEGYSRDEHRTRDLARIFQMNQLTVEHRYFGSSKPNPLDWQYLTVWQAAMDHHRIVELFKDLYPGKWISSGSSKGGDAAIFHRRFFPEDVDATVAFVAPILFSDRDTRFLEYYNIVGDAQCRQKLKDYQRLMLQNLDEFPPLFQEYVDFVNSTYGTNITFSLDYKAIIYHSIREDFPFEFWSSETVGCENIPDETSSIQELFDHYVAVMDVFLFFSDYGVDFWTPWYYQSVTEIGNYAYDIAHLEDLTMDIPELFDLGISTNFNEPVMNDIDNWVRTTNVPMMLIYGEDDPWTHAAFTVTKSENVVKIVNPGTKHSTRIENLSQENYSLVRDKINGWILND
ncbi:MAG: S28 family serine protease, partial [Bacteroidota bacterium]